MTKQYITECELGRVVRAGKFPPFCKTLHQFLCVTKLYHAKEAEGWASAELEINTQLERTQMGEGMVGECGD